MTVLVPLAWLLLGLCAVAIGLWLVVVLRLRRVLRTRPTVRAGLELPAPAASDPAQIGVSVVVPVHDEEKVIDGCVASLREQDHEPLELVFVLDRCTDGTREILERHRAADRRVRLVENDACPEGWAGKCHAAHLGAEAATGAYLLFTDADTIFDPGLVRATVALARSRDLALLSLLSTLTTDRLYERVVQPVASLHLMRMYPIDRVNRGENARPFANGQFMLFSRAWYERIGGHAAVKDDLLEDIAFARRLGKSGGRGAILLADGMLRCRMYDSLPAFRTGWKRIYIEACKRKPGRLRKNGLRVLAGGVLLPAAQAAGLGVGIALLLGGQGALGGALVATAGAGTALSLSCLAVIYGLGGSPRAGALLYPVGSWVVGRIMLGAARDLARRRPIPWGGREYVLEPR